jgi:hypothetical protein
MVDTLVGGSTASGGSLLQIQIYARCVASSIETKSSTLTSHLTKVSGCL